MRRLSPLTKLLCICGLVCLTSCHHKKNVWDDSNTAARAGGLDSYWGNAFDNSLRENELASASDDFIALNEEDLKFTASDGAIPQSKFIPGEAGSGIPSFNAFTVAQGPLKEIFQNVHFATDQYVIKDPKEIQSLQKVASYLKAHSTTYVFIEGHCDERGSESYNLALGTKRANWIRSYLVKNGASPNQIFTTSFGKEKPCAFGHSPTDWMKNRRAEFKLHTKH